MASFSGSYTPTTHNAEDTYSTVQKEALKKGRCPFHPDICLLEKNAFGLTKKLNECHRCVRRELAEERGLALQQQRRIAQHSNPEIMVEPIFETSRSLEDFVHNTLELTEAQREPFIQAAEALGFTSINDLDAIDAENVESLKAALPKIKANKLQQLVDERRGARSSSSASSAAGNSAASDEMAAAIGKIQLEAEERVAKANADAEIKVAHAKAEAEIKAAAEAAEASAAAEAAEASAAAEAAEAEVRRNRDLVRFKLKDASNLSTPYLKMKGGWITATSQASDATVFQEGLHEGNLYITNCVDGFYFGSSWKRGAGGNYVWGNSDYYRWETHGDGTQGLVCTTGKCKGHAMGWNSSNGYYYSYNQYPAAHLQKEAP
eukprot:CAMPEP_0182572754 /NCGR_PEP_ID=MMETSP1324-20130603/17869_1 /TAXON_ID=236786 /ORGANISM="Florenciella sp., Strain RCC1587" /LENGTH=376 /DNA_ID=CAMNT_0024787761 /DNA_START=229 /DNA_END=1359 /DNA_ORIENTATION=+